MSACALHCSCDCGAHAFCGWPVWRLCRLLSNGAQHASTVTCSLVKDTSSWNNKKEELAAEQANCEQLAASLAEVDEEGMRAKVKQASEERDAAQAALNRCSCWARQAVRDQTG